MATCALARREATSSKSCDASSSSRRQAVHPQSADGRKSKAPQQKSPELRAGYGNLVASRTDTTYPPVFRARPQDSYLEWKRSVEFWIRGEGDALPVELIGPRMMVQLKDRASQPAGQALDECGCERLRGKGGDLQGVGESADHTAARPASF